MKQNIKTYKCEECNDIFPSLRFDQFQKRLVDAMKYINKKIVCKKCYYKIKERNKSNGT